MRVMQFHKILGPLPFPETVKSMIEVLCPASYEDWGDFKLIWIMAEIVRVAHKPLPISKWDVPPDRPQRHKKLDGN